MASDDEEEEPMGSDEDSEKLEVIPTSLDDDPKGPTPLIFQRRHPLYRRMDKFVKIHKAFVKRRPFHSIFAIELIFNTILHEQIEIAWHILRNEILDLGYNWPYITLTASPFGHQSKLEKIIETLASKQEILPISFPSIVPGKESIYLSLSQSNPLIQFHSELCGKMTDAKIEIEESFRTGSWIPYCVVAENVPDNRMGDAVTALQTLMFPMSGKATCIRLAEYTKPEKTTFNDEGATFLFEKEITSVDAILCRFSVPKEQAKNDMIFPKIDHPSSVAIQVWDHEGRKREMVLRRYMNYTYHITADWMLPEMRMNLVAGDVILFFKLKRESVLEYPYEYMVQLK